MNSTILRFIYVCILLNCVAGCAITAGDPSTKSTKNATLEVNKQSNESLFVDMCRYGYEDYRRVKKEFEETYPIGSSGERLYSSIKQHLDVDINSHPIFDPLYSKKGDEPKHNSYFYGTIKNCNKEHGNINQWMVMYFTDLNNVITATEFRLVFDDEKFALRGIPFNFDHFYKKTGQNALWSLTGKGSTKEEVKALMAKVEEGEYGNFIRKIDYSTHERITYRYHVFPEKSLSSRAAVYRFIWRINWYFDENDLLVKLTIE